jgi:hypothetical protein
MDQSSENALAAAREGDPETKATGFGSLLGPWAAYCEDCHTKFSVGITHDPPSEIRWFRNDVRVRVGLPISARLPHSSYTWPSQTRDRCRGLDLQRISLFGDCTTSDTVGTRHTPQLLIIELMGTPQGVSEMFDSF